jgi:zinc transporter 1/2/3
LFTDLISALVGTGVLLATAFVHLLPEAMENFDSPCLDEGWKQYGAFAGVFCMISSFGLQLLELAAVSNVDRLIEKKEQKARDCEEPICETTDCTPANTTASIGSSTTQTIPEKTDGHQHHHHHHHHGHSHSAGLLEDENAFKDINTVILELGIVMHSIIIGITLANTQSTEFITLLIALVFHQVNTQQAFMQAAVGLMPFLRVLVF